MARLDRLSPIKGVAQLGATLGREFSYELLQAVSPLEEATLRQALGQLVEAELLYQRGLPPQATYLFKHALIQETAYQTLLKSRRQQYHQRIAQVLVGQFQETAETQPELLAHHYTEAGLLAQAIPCWQRAGQRALERSAHVEAIAHLTKGLEVLKALPDTPQRSQQELLLQTALAVSLMVIRGFGCPEVEGVYTRARELCRQVGETPQLYPVLVGLWRFYLVWAQLQAARELAEQLLSMAQRRQDPALLVEAHRMLGLTLFYPGELSAARSHLEQSIALYNPQQHRSLVFFYVADSEIISLSYMARVLWLLGYVDQALDTSHKALRLARDLAHPFSLAYALGHACELHQLRRDVQAAQERVEAEIALCTEQGFAYYLARATTLQGWALAEQGHGVEGRARMRQGLAAFRSTGAEALRTYYLALLAEACGNGGQVDEGLCVLAEAIATVDEGGERHWAAELYRLKGQLLLQAARVRGSADAPDGLAIVAEAESCFHQALGIAHRQQAKSLELRVAMSLSRLWQRQGKRAEARQRLAEAYDWFTEGFDTADLREAKVLLEEFSR
jgi:predicted ATPase